MNMEKAERVVKEYIERAIRYHTASDGCITDVYIDCPKCGSQRAIMYEHGRWACLYRCGFTFPAYIVPPSPEQVKEFLKKRKEEAEAQRVASLIQHLNIDIGKIEKGALRKNLKQQKFYEKIRYIV